ERRRIPQRRRRRACQMQFAILTNRVNARMLAECELQGGQNRVPILERLEVRLRNGKVILLTTSGVLGILRQRPPAEDQQHHDGASQADEGRAVQHTSHYQPPCQAGDAHRHEWSLVNTTFARPKSYKPSYSNPNVPSARLTGGTHSTSRDRIAERSWTSEVGDALVPAIAPAS